MQFTKATAHQSRLRLALIGPAGSGKTYSALSIAQHLGTKVAVIDTERGSASKYASLFGFDVLELTTFAPPTYVQAIQAADAAGYDVLVIDSLSHAWIGKGGALEMKDAAAARDPRHDSFGAWRQVTPAHNAMVDAILASRAHIITTLRTKTEYVVEPGQGGKNTVRKIGLAPVQRDGLEYEFDVVGDLDQDHTLVVTKSRCPAIADAVIPKPGKELAEQLRAWLGQGEPVAVKPQPTPHEAAAEATAYAAQRRAADGQATPPPGDTWSHYPKVESVTVTMSEADDEPPSVHAFTAEEADINAALDAAPLPGAPSPIRFRRNATGMSEFIKLVELNRPRGLGLDADARKAALNGKSVNGYMEQQGWQDEPAALDRVWAELERKVKATEAAEVAATE